MRLPEVFAHRKSYRHPLWRFPRVTEPLLLWPGVSPGCLAQKWAISQLYWPPSRNFYPIGFAQKPYEPWAIGLCDHHTKDKPEFLLTETVGTPMVLVI